MMTENARNTAAERAEQLLAAGWPVLPIKDGTKYPAGVNGWQTMPLTAATVLPILRRPDFNGLAIRLGDGLVALDIDVYDAARVDDLIATIDALIPGARWRIGQPPKVAALFRVEGEWYKRRIGYRDTAAAVNPVVHAVELLGKGQQLIIAGRHVTTGEPYRWKTSGIDDLTPAQLPLLTEAKAEAVFNEFKALAFVQGWKPVEAVDGRQTTSNVVSLTDGADDWLAYARPVNPDVTREQIERALKSIEYGGYDHWWRVGGALHHQFQGSDEGLALFHAYSKTTGLYNSSEVNKKWREYENRPRAIVTIDWLLNEAAEALKPKKESAPGDPAAGGGLLKKLSELPALKPTRWTVSDVIPAGSTHQLFGASRSFKSFVAVDLMLSVVTGRPWHGKEVTQGAAIYICGEGAGGISRRVAAWRTYHGISASEIEDGLRCTIAPIELLSDDEAGALMLELKELREYYDAAGQEIGLVVIDTLARNFGEGDENCAADMTRYESRCQRIAQITGAAVVVVHHTGVSQSASGRGRGSGAFFNAVDACHQLTRQDGAGGLEDVVINLECKKMKDDREYSPLNFGVKPVYIDEIGDTSLVVVDFEFPERRGLSPTETRILELLVEHDTGAPEDGQYKAERAPIISDSGKSKSTIYSAIKALEAEGILQVEGSEVRGEKSEIRHLLA